MVDTLFGFQIASRDDPLANVKSIRVWATRLPRNDPVGAVETTIRVLETAGSTQPIVTLSRVLAVMELDRISVPLQAQLRAQYQMRAVSDEVRQRLWRAGEDLAYWFARVYEEICIGLRARGDNQKVRAELHGIFARMFHYFGVQTRQGLFRYEQWIPGKWRVLHSAYREAREQGVVAEPFALDASTLPADRLSPEQEYLQILLLQRVNTGNLTAQQIDWAAEWLRGWAHMLRLAVAPLEGDGYWLDLGQSRGLVTRRPENPLGELLYLNVESLQGQLRVLLRRLAVQARADPGGEIEEQLSLARRLDQFWLPRAPQQARRVERQAAQRAVRVAAGWAEIAGALAARFIQKVRAPQGYYYDDYGRLRPDRDGGRSAADERQMARAAWQIHDTSDSGFRIRSSSPRGVWLRPGALLAMQLEDDARWQIGIVRRLKKPDAQQTELGVEIISRNGELVMLTQPDARGSEYGAHEIDIGSKGRSFHALYLPLQFRASFIASPTLVLPAAEFTIGRMLSLVVDGHHHDICLTDPLERTKDWVLTPLEVVR
jgi:hypothetical protein